MKVRTIPALISGQILFITFGLAFATAPEPVSIQGQVDLSTFAGTATVALGSNTLSGAVLVVPLIPPEPKNGGLYFPEVQHIFTFGENSLTTVGQELAMPMDENPAIFTLHGSMKIVDGSGLFEGAGGDLRVNGQMDWSEGQATFKAHGVVSR